LDPNPLCKSQNCSQVDFPLFGLSLATTSQAVESASTLLILPSPQTSMESFIKDLYRKISTDSAILTEDSPGFAAAHERWTDIDRKTPAVIVQPTSERDIAVLVSQLPHVLPLKWSRWTLSRYLFILQVREARAVNIPFVPATGGHSQWSTVQHGMIIDLSRYREVVVDPARRIVAVRGGVLMKELQVALSEKAQFTSMNRGYICATELLTGF